MPYSGIETEPSPLQAEDRIHHSGWVGIMLIRCQIETHEIHYDKGARCTTAVGRSLEHQTGDSTIQLGSTPVLRENTLEKGHGSPTSYPLPPTSREDLRLNGCLEYPHSSKALNIYKHPCLHRDSIPGSTALQSASHL
ncbi:uncharacterized protein TNCV_4999911 [Trichonephila clavipes]|nr:uncharacterized protein TNCV_4999911 [Trichonephila clavipes]